MNGYCKNRRKDVSGLTLRDLIKELQSYPNTADILCCGDFNVFIHYNPEENIINIDCSSLESEYDTED